MTLSKLALSAAAAGFAGFGVACLARPNQMLRKIDVKSVSAVGTTELRAMYGGMELGLGTFFVLAMLKPDLERPALIAQALGLGGLAATRVASIIRERPKGSLIRGLAAAESIAAVLAAIALIKDRPAARDRWRDWESFGRSSELRAS